MIYNVDSAIEFVDVRKRFGAREVLRGVDLAVPSGGLLGLLGANGAGKSTLIRIATGLLRADGGEARVAGVDVIRSPEKVGARIGLAPQELGLYPQLSARENLVGFARIAGSSGRAARARADELLETLALTAQARQRADRLSGGQKRRLHTGIALVARPSVIFLDEPTVGADVPARAGILDVVRRTAMEGAAIVYTTHYLPELEQLGARIAVLHEGRIAADGPLYELVDRYARPSVRLRFRGDPPELPGWRRTGDVLEPDDPVLDPGAAIAAALSASGSRGRDLVDVEVVRADLETAYLAITGDRPEGERDVTAA